MQNFRTTLLCIYILSVSIAGGATLKHMRSHGKEDHPKKSQATTLETLNSTIKEKLHISGLPLFVKFHKTGSGTAAALFRKHCANSMLLPDLDGMFPWRGGPLCGPLPHEHASIQMYRTQGIPGFEWCTLFKTKIQLYTVLRTPVEKFFSGAYFWKKEVEKSNLLGLLQDPSALTVTDIDRLTEAVHWYGRQTTKGKCSHGTCYSTRAGPLLQFTAVLGKVDLNDPIERDTPSPKTVEFACANMRRDFRVGVAEQMDSFAVLVALDNNWQLDTMCAETHHYNKNRPRGSQLMESLQPAVKAHLDYLLAPDNAIYACALEQHRSHILEHEQGGDSLHANALRQYQSTEFQDSCEARSKAHGLAIAERRKEDRKNGVKKYTGEEEWVTLSRRRRLETERPLEDGPRCVMSRPAKTY